MATGTKNTKSTKTTSKAKDTAKKEPSKREVEAKRKAEEAAKVRKQRIESKDLIVGKDVEFEKVGRETKTLARAQEILKALKASKEPVIVSEFAGTHGAFYEDVLPQFAMLEAQGEVVRYEARGGGRGRRSVAYILASKVA